MKVFRYNIFICAVLLLMISCTTKNVNDKQTNIIYILADDLGYGDLGCYGQEIIKTPNIDKMASEGILFTQHYSGANTCAPSRSSLLTGLHTGHTEIRANLEVPPEGQQALSEKAFTLAKMLKKAGYSTAAFGEWGLGMPYNEGSPLKQGFDVFFGYMSLTHANRYYPKNLWENDHKYSLEGNDGISTSTYAPDIIHEKLKEFIKENHNKPFFLYAPLLLPHAELIVPNDSFLSFYKGKFPEPRPFKGNDYGNKDFKTSMEYCSQETPRTVFAAMISRLDYYVGDILDLLKSLGIEKNTLVIFSSDNGPHKEGGADPDFFKSNGVFRGYKGDLYEGGIRVPMIAWWPGTIKANSVTDHISASWDIMPTLAELTRSELPESIDGISLIPALTGKRKQQVHDYLYWEFHERGGRKALRAGKWKIIKFNVLGGSKIELYDLSVDPGEERDLSISFPQLVNELEKTMELARTESEIFKFPCFCYLHFRPNDILLRTILNT